MKVVEILFEGKKRDEALKFIKTNCKPFLKQANGVLLYRGMDISLPKKQIGIYPCPINRAPKDTPDELHKIVDDWFFKKFRVYYRSNAVFCTGSSTMAKWYGDLYAVFPIGNFKFCWSPNVYDLYKLFEDDYNIDNLISNPNKVKKIIEKSGYTDKNFREAILAHNEIMIHCDKYVAVHAPWLITGYNL